MAQDTLERKYPEIKKLTKQVTEGFRYAYGAESEQFLPDDKLDEFVTPDIVRKILAETGIFGVQLEKLVNFVFNAGARRLFLIFVLIFSSTEQHFTKLEDLQECGVTDDSLPLGFVNGHGRTLEKEEHNMKEYPVFEKWDQNLRTLFGSNQWQLIAPVFRETKFQHKFNKNRILPYLEVAKKPTSSGFFGEVSQVMIHPAHIPALKAKLMPGVEGIKIAIKKAKNIDDLAEFFDKEAKNLEELRQYKSHHLIKPIAAYSIHNDRCLIFPWANGGNLSNYWETHDKNRKNQQHLQWVFDQLVGICSALELLHDNNCRHGDLKPENILWFRDGNSLGMLQLADLGLAKFHEKEANTRQRDRRNIHTSTPSGTSRYEPPEMDENRGTTKPRSRQYDIWSMGCIIIELLVWLIHGYEDVQTFRKHTRYFWTPFGEKGTPTQKYSIDSHVTSCLDFMESRIENNKAQRDLLDLVRKKLLIVPVHEIYESKEGYREIARELHRKILDIQKRCQSDHSYLGPISLEYSSPEIHVSPHQPMDMHTKGGLLAAQDPQELQTGRRLPDDPQSNEMTLPRGDGVPDVVVNKADEISPAVSLGTQQSTIPDKQEQSRKLNDVWDTSPDNTFASNLFNIINWSRVKPDLQPHATLCTDCRHRSWGPPFQFNRNTSELVSTSMHCDLCRLLQEALIRRGFIGPNMISLRCNGSVVGVDNGPNLLSLYVNPAQTIPPWAQLGLPKLITQGSLEQFTLLKEWIRVCDSTHRNCKPYHDERANRTAAPPMPTRLLELGEPLRIVNSNSIGPHQYVALSHCWGSSNDVGRFCAYKHNIMELMQSIDSRRLPRTFQDAVTVARGIGIMHLWIDSLCIIQDDGEDWESESTRMDQVFSGAYCTIGVGSAKSSFEGFLKDRNSRPCVQLEVPNVGQISKAAFLGDANFPQSALEYYRDGRQMLVQDLYERYSALAFTRPCDRSVAILGLQERLAKAFKTRAAYGFFPAYFARLLLWKRDSSQYMVHIEQKQGTRQHAPTWSWFSKKGAIKYMKLEFQEIDWAKGEFHNPFQKSSAQQENKGTESRLLQIEGSCEATLRGFARRLIMTQSEMMSSVTFDEAKKFHVDDLRCVVIGRDRLGTDTGSLEHHAIIIHKESNGLHEEKYERVGGASLKPESIDNEGIWVVIW
ncbi:hypothetical protein QQS21_007262 [Conoideocrella luteorostrata]|uniref:Protein kinase domain-containing protein n=1 Tax=Conoideocrella luteorostrata TaxID=1105319 RepID=A0AAJ0CNF7_9HYPO|nr:hypothetical protein QQS21_007262 [Conoideocrella luteorostrata]